MSAYRYAFALLLLTTVCVDLATKYWFWQSRPDLVNQSYFDLIFFQAHQNSGLMLGIGAQLEPALRLLLTIFLPGLVLTGLLSFVLYRGFSHAGLSLAWGLLIGGGFSNLIERIESGSVSDFILLRLGDFHSGIFNPADLANLIGLVTLIGFILFRSKLR